MIDRESGGAEASEKTNVENIKEEKVPIHLLQPSDTLENDDVWEWVAVSPLRSHLK